MANSGIPPVNARDGSGQQAPEDMSRPDPLRTNTNMTKAQKFEEEKKRIIDTCFMKRDDTGKRLQSYITHVKVEEDAAFQSSPPPPDSNPQYKKPRAIVLAVKSSGRVAMHKARENDNGDFQIGKSWGLEELVSIESYSNTLPKTAQQQQHADWAGALGFTITMSKPYYWQAKSQKEKEFFIGSLVKIYNKFTGGKLPELIGFDQKDKDAIIASTRPSGAYSARQTSSTAPSSDSTSPAPPYSLSTAPQSDMINPLPPEVQPPTPSFAPPERPFVGQERRPSSNSSSQGSRPAHTPSGEFQPPAPYRSPQAGVAGPRPYQQSRQPGASAPRYPSPGPSANGMPQLRSRPSREQGVRQASPYQSYTRSPGPAGASEPTDPSRLRPRTSRSNFRDSSRTTSASSATPTASPRRPSSPSYLNTQNGDAIAPAQSNSLDGAPVPLASSTTARWKPFVSDAGGSTAESFKTAPESASSSLRSRQGGEEPLQTGTVQKIPERRRPPLQESAYGDSTRSQEQDGARPKTPAESGLTVPNNNERPVTPTTPQPPGAFVTADPAPAGSPALKKEEQSAASATSADRSINANGEVKPSEPEQTTSEQQQYRPGLGPMIGKKSAVADKFRKAATAHRAFVPRAGGAGERLAKTKDAGDSDRITDVIPARSTARNSTKEEARPKSPEPQVQDKRFSPAVLDIPQRPQSRELQDTEAKNQGRPTSVQLEDPGQPDGSSGDLPRPLSVQKIPRPASQPPVVREKLKRKPNPFADAFANLGIDPALALDPRTIAFEDQLNDFGWECNFLQKKNLDSMHASMRKEVGKVEASSWLGHSDEKDARVDDFEKSLDKAIAAVDEMDGLLTLYSVELSTLVEDVTYIEAQSQGLQVQTANQKLLQNELETLVSTVSLDSRQLEPLQTASVGDTRGLEAIEGSLSLLYRALQKIDPSSIHGNSSGSISGSNPGQGLRALQERKQQYMNEADSFLQRLKLYVDPAFGSALSKARETLQRASVSSRNGPSAHEAGRAELWPYSPLMLFVKEISPATWKDLLKIYRDRARGIYQDETRESITEWKKRSRKIGLDDNDILFTSQEKEVESTGLASTAARKMTIKRSGTLARSLRQASHKERTGSSMPKGQDANQLPYEVFAGVLADSVPIISTEQNFVTDFFHASGLENMDFVDAVNAERPSQRQGTDLFARRMNDPDRSMADTVRQTVENIFAAWSIETQALLEWALGQHQLQGVGILYTLERLRLDLADSNQEYLLKVLSQQYSWLLSKFKPFVDSQIQAIETTKIKTTKRRGVMAFIRIFPTFVAAVEGMLQPADIGADLGRDMAAMTAAPETRGTVDDAYERLVSAMFHTLDSIAKEVPNTASGTDPEDKEKLNAEILLIENCWHLSADLAADPSLLRNSILLACRQKADTSMRTHRTRYLNAVIRRPLGRLLDFLEGVEADRSKSGQATYGRSAFKKVLGAYDAKTVRRDIEQLKRRVEKHFGGEGAADDQSQYSSGQGHARLVGEMLAESEARYLDVLERTEVVVRDVYAGELEMGFSRVDVGGAFRR